MQIVITGVSRGLGRALTTELITRGHQVIGCARHVETVLELQQTFPKPHDFSTVDVADDSQVNAWSHHVLSKFGPPDILINNAGLMNPLGPLWELSAAAVDPVIDVNIKGVMNVIRHFVTAMVETHHGLIVNFSSGWGRSTSPQVAPYCATKWAVEGLTQALAQELPQGMAAIALNPGIIYTDMLAQCFGLEAADYPPASVWAAIAADTLLQLQATDNGRSLSVPLP